MICVIRDGLVEKDFEEEAAKAARLELDDANKSIADSCRVGLCSPAPPKRRNAVAGLMAKLIQIDVHAILFIMVACWKIFLLMDRRKGFCCCRKFFGMTNDVFFVKKGEQCGRT